MVEAEDDRGGEERADRDKRKIAVAKLGVSNGIINFVFNVRFVFDEIYIQKITFELTYTWFAEAGFVDRCQDESSERSGRDESNKEQGLRDRREQVCDQQVHQRAGERENSIGDREHRAGGEHCPKLLLEHEERIDERVRLETGPPQLHRHRFELSALHW